MYTCEKCERMVSFDASGEPICACDKPGFFEHLWVLFSDWVEEMAS